tara:strand:+ start:463 stop:852 length:390 start_codon:yes stop_codon:yes gene_type:complete
MANPNIVNVATINGESQGFNLTATPTTVLIAAISSGKVVKVNRITVANVDGTNAADVTVAVVKAGYTSAANGATISTVTAHIAKTISVPADATLVLLDTPMYMQEGDVLQGGAGAASDLDLVVSYDVIA